MTSKRKKKKRLRFFIKTILSLVYLLIIGILCFASFRLYQQDQKIYQWQDVDNVSQYSSIEISEMSEAFAEIKGEDKTVHFVIEREETGAWHTYLIAVSKSDYAKYQPIIDRTYERTEEDVEPFKVYGYPVLISKDIKTLAIKNIKNFVPIENQIVLDEDNFEQYMTNTYLDTTKEKKHAFNHIILILLLMALILFIVLLFTIFDKDKIVDEVDEIIEKKEKKKKKTSKKSSVKKKEKMDKEKQEKKPTNTVKNTSSKNKESSPKEVQTKKKEEKEEIEIL